jgi:DNA-binding transcriptional ArsR family regulator
MSFAGAFTRSSDAQLEERARLLSALGHTVRLRIIERLLSGECCVGNMVECLDLPQPLVSRHLAVLRDAGIVEVEPLGRQREYRVVHAGVVALMRCLEADCPRSSGPKQQDAARAAAKE